MKYIKMRLLEQFKGLKSYSFIESSKDDLELLGHFLTEDINDLRKLANFKKYFFMPDIEDIGYEWTGIIKKESSIIIYDALFEFGTEQASFELSLDCFVSVINEWEKILKIMPHEVTITEEEDKITFDYKI